MSDNSYLRKAAVLLMTLNEDDAAMLLSRLDPREVEHVSIEIAKLGRLTGDEQATAVNEFFASNPNSFGTGKGGLDLAKTLVAKALGNNARATLDNVQQSIEALPFGFLKQVDPQNLMTFIVDEHPQTIALILSHLPPAYGALVVSGLAPERQLAVIRRVANMGQTTPEIIKEVEQALERRMSSVMRTSYQNAGGIPSVAEILNVTDRATERTLLENLAQEDPNLVEEIRRLMFVFDDVTKLPNKDIQSLLKHVENSQWATALKGASEELKQKILGNMSTRAGEMLREEMEFLGPVRLSDVEAAQQIIVDIVRRLEDAGEITLNAGEEQEQFIQ